MTATYRLVFVNEGGQKSVFDLNPTSFLPAQAESADSDATILVLPAAAALPFQLELPFSDQAKIARVLPQFVADLYVDVDESWLFSWLVMPPDPEKSSCVISGLAFPASWGKLLQENSTGCRLAISDLMLAGGHAGQAVRLITPVSETIAVFSGPHSIRRLFSASSGIPVDLLLNGEGIEACREVKVGEEASTFYERIESLLSSAPETLDLSGFRQRRREGLRRLMISAGAMIVLAWVILWHLFIWLECRITERAAQRTRNHMQQAFSTVFPGVPVVEPLTQVSRSITELEKRLKEAATVPILPWQRVLQVISVLAGSDTAALRLSGRETGFKISGVAVNYAALENFRSRLEGSGLFEKVNTTESRQGGSGIDFNLEAIWKK